jgi:hypothetical protein
MRLDLSRSSAGRDLPRIPRGENLGKSSRVRVRAILQNISILC